MQPVQPLQLVVVDSRGIPGALGAVASCLADAGINIDGFSVHARRICLMTSDAGQAKRLLEGAGFLVQTLQVAGLSLANRPGALATVAAALHENGIEIVHSFGIGHGTHGTVFIRLDEIKRALDVLHGVDPMLLG